MTTLCLLAGCNGAGKTTAAFTLLTGLLDCLVLATGQAMGDGTPLGFGHFLVWVSSGRLRFAAPTLGWAI